MTLSWIVTPGNRPRPWGGGVFDGDDDTPLPNRFGTTMKKRAGSSALPAPIRNSLSAWLPPNRVQ